MTSTEFWKLVQRRRNHFYFVWMGWLVAAPILIALYSRIPIIGQSSYITFLALGTWGAFWFYIYSRLLNLLCYKCGEKAISHAMFFMKHAKCKNCGVIPNET